MKIEKDSSGCTRFLLVMLTIIGIGGVLLCGGVGYLAWWGLKEVQFSQDPEIVQKVVQDITEIQIPAPLNPAVSIRLKRFEFTIAVFSSPDPQEKLVLGQGKLGQNSTSLEKEMEKTSNSNLKDLEITSQETREFTIREQKSKFTFAEGKHRKTGQRIRLVTGTFPSKTSSAILIYMVPAESYDETKIIKMIDSIH